MAPVAIEQTPAPTTGATAAPVAIERTPAPTPGETTAPTSNTDTPAPTTGETAAPTATVTAAPTTGETAAPTAAVTAERTASPTSQPTSLVIAPTLMPTISPTVGSTETPTQGDEFTRVRLTDYYLVYVVELLEDALPENQLETLISNSQDFYATLFEEFYEGTETAFVGVEITPKEVLFGDALPPAESFNDPDAAWNYYIHFDADILYESGTTGIVDVGTHFDVMAATEPNYVT